VHPTAGEIELPLLVPAFSSKGFELRKAGEGPKHDYTETVYELDTFGKFPSEAVLVSAYDLHFRHFEDVPDLPAGEPTAYLRNTRLVFVDSGGYELVPDFDTTETRTFAYRPKKGFGRNEYEGVLRSLEKFEEPLPLVIANFDYGTRRKPLTDQIEAARDLFREYGGCLTNFILKPWKKTGTVVEPKELSDTGYANLRGFDIIGVTEKELGSDTLDRLRRVARLRKGLDDAGVTAPIHVWGGLDPVMTPLYFFAGAEIFDGVSWLRYAFRNGVAINREVHSILTREMGISASKKLNHAYASMSNLNFLKNLSISLQQWLDFEATNFDMFHPDVAGYLEKAYGVMKTRIDLLKGGT
jgi:hypothetical protein